MKKKKLFLTIFLAMMGADSVIAQHAYTYVQQDGVKINELGTAAFALTDDRQTKVEFDENGKAVMTVGNNIVAKLPMSVKGQLVVEFETTVAKTDLNKVTKTYSNEYATLYSPFQLQVPINADVETYAPTYDAERHVLKCNDGTIIAEGSVIPCETALLLKNAGTVVYEISADASTVSPSGALSGSSLKIAKPAVANGETLYTLGHNDEEFAFFSYSGTILNPGLAWLVAGTISEQEAKCISISFDDDAVTSVSELPSHSSAIKEKKYIENGRVVIVKNGKKYNLNGQEVR